MIQYNQSWQSGERLGASFRAGWHGAPPALQLSAKLALAQGALPMSTNSALCPSQPAVDADLAHRVLDTAFRARFFVFLPAVEAGRSFPIPFA